MKSLWLIAAVFIGITFSTSGCMMMHKGMHGEENHGGHSAEATSAENRAEETKTGEAPRKESHKEHSKSKKTSKTLMVLGGVGMGLMMLLMFL